ncbi:MAG TPA: serine hydrolase [Labilithrix sp.]|nr:serine hydrolase [Labilithrix sp.]
MKTNRRTGGLVTLAIVLSGCGALEPDVDSSESNLELRPLAETVAALAAEAPARSPGTEAAIAVRDLTTDEYAGANDIERHVSASSQKLIWVAAAMSTGADVTDIAGPIFRYSDNNISGIAIDRAGGADAVNQFMWDLGMDRSLLANWNNHHASEQGRLGGNNYFTAKDTVHFLTRLDRGEILDGPRKDELEHYMTWSPRTGAAAPLATLLPAEVRASMMHKSGWLPRQPYVDLSVMNDIGIVQVPGGHRYAVSILLHHGLDYWGKQRQFLEYASCEIYRSISRDAALNCNGGGGGACTVQDGKLNCPNASNTPMHQKPSSAADSPIVNTLRTTKSWFTCWVPGELHAGGNTTWYFTQGDDNANWGFVPGSALETPDAFDADPTARGLARCAD